MGNGKSRIVLQFNDYDFRHRKTLEILKSHPRNKTEMVVSAIMHYINCPEAGNEVNKEAIRKVVEEVIQDMIKDGALTSPAANHESTSAASEDLSQLSGMMTMFRGDPN